MGQPASDYWFRGGLWGGPSSCSAPAGNLYDYYSRFDQVFPAISQYLAPTSGACGYSLSPTSVTVGSGATSVTAYPGKRSTALIAPAGRPG